MGCNGFRDCTKEERAAGQAKGRTGGRQEHERFVKERVNLVMKVREMKKLKRTMVAGLAAFMLLAESVTAFACPAEPHDEASCECAEHGAVMYDEQFVDMDGNVTPVSGISPRVICLKHKIVEGYYQTHVKNSSGGCTVKTYYSTQCIYCNTIWLGDLDSIAEFAKCPHADVH